MIVITKRHINNAGVNKEIIEVLKGDYDYYGLVLSPALLKVYQREHNVAISYAIYEAVGEADLKTEVERITGERVTIQVIKHDAEKPNYRNDNIVAEEITRPAVIIKRVSNYWLEKTTSDYILHDYNDVVGSVNIKEMPLNLEDVKQRIKAKFNIDKLAVIKNVKYYRRLAK